ncbi:MAG: efflux RND transporter permease subunit, partial [Acetobacteraceae bacterium]
MNLSAPFIARPIATSLLAVAVLLAGLLGYQALPVSSLPEVAFPTIQVSTELPGASPDTMARLITAPLERGLGQIPGLDAMSSQSTAGLSAITLRFSLARNIDSAAADVQAAISAAAGTLPPNLPYPPVFAKVNPADAPILTLALTSRRMPLYRVADAADTLLAQTLSQITGVGQVSVAGGLQRALRVRVDPARLAGYGLSMEDVRLALAAANQNGAKGGFDGAKQAIALGANDQISTPAGYRNLVIAWRNGAPVHLSDVGTVVVGLLNDRVDASWQGKPAVVVDIRRQPGANIVATVDTILARLPAIERALPAGIAVKVVADRTSTIRASVRDVQATLLLSVALVVGVIFLFLRTWRATLVPALALPLSLIGTFGVMALIGYGLDNLSLMALTVAAGFVVDDAIVMIENVVRHIELGETPLAAAYRGAKQIGFTIVSLTVSLIAVFIPLLFMTGVVGRLFHAFAITLSIAVVVSAVVSLTLSPMLCGRLLRPAAQERPGALARALERAFAGLLGLYRRSLRWTLARQGLFLAIAALTLAGTVWLYVAVPKGFLPTQDTGEILAVTQGAQDISIPALKRLQARAVRAAMADPAVAGVVSLLGSGVANPTPDTGRLVIVLKPIGARPPIGPVMASLARRFAPITGLTVFQQPVQDITIGSRVSRTQYQYTLVDSSAGELARWAPRLLARLRALPQLRNVASDAQNGGLAVAVTVDRASAMRLGVSMQSVENVLYDAFGQRQISTIFAQS